MFLGSDSIPRCQLVSFPVVDAGLGIRMQMRFLGEISLGHCVPKSLSAGPEFMEGVAFSRRQGWSTALRI